MRSIFYTLACTALLLSNAAYGQSITVDAVKAFPKIRFTQPTDIQNAGDGSNRLFVVSKLGSISVFENQPDAGTAHLFLDLRNRVETNSEMGLLGLAFHPGYEENGFFYVNYNIQSGDSMFTLISRFSRNATDPDKADTASELVLMKFSQPYPNHKGGQLAFGPDGYLYIAVGDGGAGGDPQGNGQNTTRLLGKILRIDVDHPANGMNYGIPGDNPFAGDPNKRQEIYAYGLRNPWRFSFDSQTGKLWAGDVGQDNYEEIDIIEKGKNYGWNVREGWHCYSPSSNCDSTGMTGPIWEYSHSVGSSITGGHIYHGLNIPELEGYYIYTDYVRGQLWGLQYDNDEGRVVRNLVLNPSIPAAATFGVDEANELYFASFNNGDIYKLQKRVSSVLEEPESGGAVVNAIRPNPATDRMRIPYALKVRGYVLLTLQSESGEEVARLVDREQEPGNYEVEFDARNLPESVYYCQLKVGERLYVRSVAVVR